MEIIEEIHIKNRTYYFFDNMTNIKNFHSNLLKTGGKLYKDIDIFYIGYISIKHSDHAKINSVNSLWLIIKEFDGYLEKIIINKYFALASTDKDKKVLTKYTELLIK